MAASKDAHLEAFVFIPEYCLSMSLHKYSGGMNKKF
jgi:hypothetical protein